jgi:hypothetical protein
MTRSPRKNDKPRTVTKGSTKGEAALGSGAKEGIRTRISLAAMAVFRELKLLVSDQAAGKSNPRADKFAVERSNGLGNFRRV